MKGLLLILLYLVTGVFSLICRRCDRASTLDDCTQNVHCSQNEDCYMEEVITEQLTVQYNGGCRARDVCSRVSPGGIGRRQTLVACSKCCTTDSCNVRSCGIKSLNTTQCYECDSSVSGAQGDVRNPSDCVTLTTCQSDEVCYAKELVVAGMSSFRYGCYNKQLCQLLTQRILQHTPGSIGKRAPAEICMACCADAGCNYGECQDVVAKIRTLWRAGVFDVTTMRQNGTLVSPSG